MTEDYAVMSRWSRDRRDRRGPYVELSGPVDLSEADVKAIFCVLDEAVYAAGRTAVMMALRGSRAEKVRRLGLVGQTGHGYFAGMREEEVLARIDTFFHRGWLRFERTKAGLPLLGYTEAGLAEAKAYVVERWLEELRSQVAPVARGEVLRLSFLMNVDPQRNQDTVLLLAERFESVADRSWLPVLRAWCAAETKRVRGRLRLVIERLEGME